MIFADARHDLGKLLGSVIQAGFDGLERFALGGDLRGFQGPGLEIDCQAASFFTRSVSALVYSVFNCNSREESTLVFSSGL